MVPPQFTGRSRARPQRIQTYPVRCTGRTRRYLLIYGPVYSSACRSEGYSDAGPLPPCTNRRLSEKTIGVLLDFVIALKCSIAHKLSRGNGFVNSFWDFCRPRKTTSLILNKPAAGKDDFFIHSTLPDLPAPGTESALQQLPLVTGAFRWYNKEKHEKRSEKEGKA